MAQELGDVGAPEKVALPVEADEGAGRGGDEGAGGARDGGGEGFGGVGDAEMGDGGEGEGGEGVWLDEGVGLVRGIEGEKV